ncbi:hypothetical protein ILUMI_19721 [Ignelater luminosus]|uniref:Uncharacterized protein n=1 Tax=Ignelater luminosus TaxID=2038154 RepID=A0A8K0G2Y0_IGNLU|nr:hypothetical protein ILUMI_19721 [Ignelater luminosus]
MLADVELLNTVREELIGKSGSDSISRNDVQTTYTNILSDNCIRYSVTSNYKPQLETLTTDNIPKAIIKKSANRRQAFSTKKFKAENTTFWTFDDDFSSYKPPLYTFCKTVLSGTKKILPNLEIEKKQFDKNASILTQNFVQAFKSKTSTYSDNDKDSQLPASTVTTGTRSRSGTATPLSVGLFLYTHRNQEIKSIVTK